MSAIAIQIPQITGEQDIEVEVKINEQKRSYNLSSRSILLG